MPSKYAPFGPGVTDAQYLTHPSLATCANISHYSPAKGFQKSECREVGTGSSHRILPAPLSDTFISFHSSLHHETPRTHISSRTERLAALPSIGAFENQNKVWCRGQRIRLSLVPSCCSAMSHSWPGARPPGHACLVATLLVLLAYVRAQEHWWAEFSRNPAQHVRADFS